MTREQIDEGFRELVRRRQIVGWYTFMWTSGRHWTFCPVNARSVTYERVGAVEYLRMAGVLAT